MRFFRCKNQMRCFRCKNEIKCFRCVKKTPIGQAQYKKPPQQRIAGKNTKFYTENPTLQHCSGKCSTNKCKSQGLKLTKD